MKPGQPRFVSPLDPADAMQAIETLSKPLVTLLENFQHGQLETVNKEVTFTALEHAVEHCRVAYSSIKRGGAA